MKLQCASVCLCELLIRSCRREMFPTERNNVIDPSAEGGYKLFTFGQVIEDIKITQPVRRMQLR